MKYLSIALCLCLIGCEKKAEWACGDGYVMVKKQDGKIICFDYVEIAMKSNEILPKDQIFLKPSEAE